MVTAMGAGVLVWRPCRDREARAPRAAVAMLLLASASVWAGSFAVVIHAIGGSPGLGGSFLAACGDVLRSLLTGGSGWWQSALLIGWVVLLPGRALWRTRTEILATRGLMARVRLSARGTSQGHRDPAGDPLRRGARPPVVVPDLGTPALTLGVLRPTVAVDAGFWVQADTTDRSVVLAHGQGHQRGRHGLVGLATHFLTAGLAPLRCATETRDCVRRHL